MLGRIFWEEGGGVDIRVKVKRIKFGRKKYPFILIFSSNNLRNNPSI